MTAAGLKDQVVIVLGETYHVLQAQDLGDEWSLVCYEMPGGVEPDVPIIQHLMVPPGVIEKPTACSTPALLCSAPTKPCPDPEGNP